MPTHCMMLTRTKQYQVSRQSNFFNWLESSPQRSRHSSSLSSWLAGWQAWNYNMSTMIITLRQGWKTSLRTFELRTSSELTSGLALKLAWNSPVLAALTLLRAPVLSRIRSYYCFISWTGTKTGNELFVCSHPFYRSSAAPLSSIN